ncbi:Maf family protein [Spirochaeta africana]|uniref:Nucleoside triphosphate pyrophosphatase n=1 Tax=Spirochaeta africana (strain ATCC 700263 / DSM 8902 / Z-7692) TaxID=889378 RepID=H9UKJ2_SPIAZ|nr:Maf family protein [Spirochaeta africana]AFG38035.1 MAF protein [Spirochaeta africana DSM 8902]
MNEPPEIILASQSPQRSRLLQQLGLRFHVDPVPTDEQIAPGSSPEQAVCELALQKAAAYRAARDLPRNDRRILLTADTVVTIDGDILGKPADRRQAAAFLARLSGRRHTVYTGVHLSISGAAAGSGITFADAADVCIRTLDTTEIEHYLELAEWDGAAGGYRIQGVGGALVERIEGAYPTVVGLPIHRIYGMVWQIVAGGLVL